MEKWKKKELMEKQKISDILSDMDHVQFLQKALVGFQEGRYKCFLVTKPSNLPQGILREARAPSPQQLSLCPGLRKWAFCQADKAKLTPTPQEKGGFLDFCRCNPEGQINKA